MFENTASLGQGEGDIRKVERRVFNQMVSEICGHRFERRGRAGGKDQDLGGSRSGGGRGFGSFLDHDMRIGPADTKCADPGPSRRVAAFPGDGFLHRIKRTPGKINARIGRMEMEEGRDDFVFKLEDRFDQSGRARRHIEMSDVGLTGSQRTETVAGRAAIAEGLRQGRDFNRIAQRSAGPVGLDVGNRIRCDRGGGLCHGNDVGLRIHTRGRVADFLRSVIVDCAAADHGQDRVGIGQGVRKALEQDDGRAMTEDRAFRAGVE